MLLAANDGFYLHRFQRSGLAGARYYHRLQIAIHGGVEIRIHSDVHFLRTLAYESLGCGAVRCVTFGERHPRPNPSVATE